MSTEPAMVPDGEAMAAPIELRLTWRKTWADQENDFVGYADNRRIGRIYPGQYPAGTWRWFFQGTGPEIPPSKINGNGSANSAREAAKAIEDIWFRFMPESIGGSTRNSYAAVSDPD